MVHNHDAYERGKQRNIKANAAKTRRNKWLAEHADAQRLYDWLNGVNEFADKCSCGKVNCNAMGTMDEHTIVHNEFTKSMFAGDGFGGLLLNLRNSLYEWGGLSEKQTAIVRNALEKKEKWVADGQARLAEYKKRDSKSSFIGKVSERLVFKVTVERRHHYDGDYGRTYFNICRDQSGNLVVYKGSRAWDKGEQIKVRATIKEHSEFNGAKQTIINRPKILS